MLFGARLTHDDGRNDFKVRRIWRQRKMDTIAVKFTVIRYAEVIFHIPRTKVFAARRDAAKKFKENCRVRLLHDGGHDIQAPAVRHAEIYVF